MNRRIVTWVATGAVVLGIGAAGVGAVVANSNASAQSSAPAAAAPAMTATSTTASTQGSTGTIGSGGLLQTGEPGDGQDQGQSALGAAQQAGGTAAVNAGSAGQAQGG
jgi:hypothetical protein